VASLEEGLHLRYAGISQPIVLMEGLFNETELTRAIAYDFTIVVHQEEQVRMLERYARSRMLPIWLKIDTGMHRLGFAPSEVASIHERLMRLKVVKKPIGLMTHFASADAIDRDDTLKQIELFNVTTEQFTGPRSLANSAGIIAWPDARAQVVRPGIMLYGASPLHNKSGIDHNLHPVMTLTSELIAIHALKKGESVGYGGTWTCPEDMRVGIVGLGYGDGYPRHVKNGAPMLVNGKECPLIGRVAMDMLSVDLRSQPEAKLGDPVTLWGAGLPVEMVAEYSETTAYELLTRITQRVRVAVKTDDASLVMPAKVLV
jgi:alanine racemase